MLHFLQVHPRGESSHSKRRYDLGAQYPFLRQTQPHCLGQNNDNLLVADVDILAPQLGIHEKGLHLVYFYHILGMTMTSPSIYCILEVSNPNLFLQPGVENP